MGVDLSPELLARIVGRTLEEAAFVFAETSQDAAPFEGTVIEARMGYSGPSTGEIRLAAAPAFAATLAANLLGTEPDDPEATSREMDAVGELLNMVCGMLVPELFGPHAAYRLDIPAVLRLTAEEHEARITANPCRVTLVEEGGQRIDAFALVSTGGKEGGP
jgi:hypothetical protein